MRPGHLSALIKAFEDNGSIFSDPLLPLFKDAVRKHPELYATAFAVRVKETDFIISAAHSFKPAYEHKPIYSYRDGWFSVAGELKVARVTGDDVKDTHNIDVGVLRLDNPKAPPLTPMTLPNMLPDFRPGGDEIILTMGFPASKTIVNMTTNSIKSQAYASFGPSVAPSDYPLFGLNPDHHIALHFDANNVLRKSGPRGKFPNPHGMSGSPLWVMRLRDEVTVEFGLIGVLIEYRAQHKILVGTTIAAPLGVMHESVG